MHIADVVRTKGDEVATLPADAGVPTLLDVLAEKRIGAVVVLEGDALAGIVSERDVVRRLQREGEAALGRTVGELMTRQVHTCSRGDSIDDVLRRMTERRVRHVPVVDEEGRLGGLVSIGDLVKFRIEELQTERDQLTAYISG